MQISHVALVDDVEHAARGEAQRRDNGQRHERERHKRVDPARDAELEGLLLGIFERFVDLDERRFAHDARDLENAKEKAFALGVSRGVDPFMTLSFMALPVIPTLRLTTRGVFDTVTQKYV